MLALDPSAKRLSHVHQFPYQPADGGKEEQWKSGMSINAMTWLQCLCSITSYSTALSATLTGV